jgi:hypothetical protein
MTRLVVGIESIRDAWRVRRYRRKQQRVWGKMTFPQRVLALSFMRD